MEKINIKKATISDLNDILYLQDLEKEDILSLNSIKNDLNNENCIYFLAYLEEKIVAYIACSYILDTMDILSLLVSKDFRRKKLGSLLILKILEFAKNNDINTITLEVRKQNKAAINLYEKFRFNKISERKNYYKTDDALIYQLELYT